jgi:hypothetical protein
LSLILTSAVVGTWLVLAAALAAIGGVFFRRVGRIESNIEYFYYSIWTGLALLVLALYAWHFFLPLDGSVQVGFGVVAVIALVIERRWFRPLVQVSANLPFAVGALVLTAWVANHALAGGGMDDYNYEFQAVRWFVDYPLVPGLANLHGRIGFNNSHHLFAALLSAGAWRGQVNHILNGFVVSLVLVFLLFALVKLLQTRAWTAGVWMFGALLFAPVAGVVLFGIFGPAISTLKADVFVSAGVILLSSVFLRFASAAAGTSDYRVAGATAILLGCLLATVKLSAVMFCGVIVLSVLGRASRDGRPVLRDALLVGAAAAGALLLASFVIRGIVLSGYPLYPSTLLPMNVDWRVPIAQADAERTFIKTWAQLRPTYDAATALTQGWLTGWLRSLILTERLTILLPLTATAVLAAAYTPKKGPDAVLAPRWALVVLAMASALALGVWFTQAPAARFASVYFWIPLAAVVVGTAGPGTRSAGAIPLAVAAAGVLAATWMLTVSAQVESQYWHSVYMAVVFGIAWAIAVSTLRDRPTMLAVLCLALGLSQVCERAGAHLLQGRPAAIGDMLWHHVTALPEQPQFHATPQQTLSGLTIYVSRSASFLTPIPNTPYFNPYLELRDPAAIKHGFRNRASAVDNHGYSIDTVTRPGTEIVVPLGR